MALCPPIPRLLWFITSTQIGLHAMASHLIAREAGDIALIDTVGSFSPIRLRDVVVLHLSQDTESNTYSRMGFISEDSGENRTAIQEKAEHMLERVKIMRVFDFTGLTEAIGEVGEFCGRIEKDREVPNEYPDKGNKERVYEVADSEEEEDGEEKRGVDEQDQSQKSAATLTDPSLGGIDMIVIDSLGHAIGPIMSRNPTQGTSR